MERITKKKNLGVFAIKLSLSLSHAHVHIFLFTDKLGLN